MLFTLYSIPWRYGSSICEGPKKWVIAGIQISTKARHAATAAIRKLFFLAGFFFGIRVDISVVHIIQREHELVNGHKLIPLFSKYAFKSFRSRKRSILVLLTDRSIFEAMVDTRSQYQ